MHCVELAVRSFIKHVGYNHKVYVSYFFSVISFHRIHPELSGDISPIDLWKVGAKSFPQDAESKMNKLAIECFISS